MLKNIKKEAIEVQQKKIHDFSFLYFMIEDLPSCVLY